MDISEINVGVILFFVRTIVPIMLSTKQEEIWFGTAGNQTHIFLADDAGCFLDGPRSSA